MAPRPRRPHLTDADLRPCESCDALTTRTRRQCVACRRAARRARLEAQLADAHRLARLADLELERA